MQTRNALIIMMRILPHFPMLSKLKLVVEKRVEKVVEDERNQRQDLFVLASSYMGQLKSRSSEMMVDTDFHQVPPIKTAMEIVAKVMNGNGANVIATAG